MAARTPARTTGATPSESTRKRERGLSFSVGPQPPTPTPAKKAKVDGSGPAPAADTVSGPSVNAEDKSDDEDESPDSQDFVTFGGKRFRQIPFPEFDEDSVIAFSTCGAELGRYKSDLEAEVKFKTDGVSDFTCKPSWIFWKTQSDAKAVGCVMPRYICINDSTQAMINHGHTGWLPHIDPIWLKSWIVEFSVDITNTKALELVLRDMVGKPNKHMEAYFTRVQGKPKPDGSKERKVWELRLAYATDQKLFELKHGGRTSTEFQYGSDIVVAKFRAHSGCSLCWDVVSKPGNRHVASGCPMLDKANKVRVKKGLDPIIIVDGDAVSNIGQRGKLPLEDRIAQLEQEGQEMRKNAKESAARIAALESKLEKMGSTSGGGYSGAVKGMNKARSGRN